MKQPKSHPAAGNRVATRGGSYSLAVTALVLALPGCGKQTVQESAQLLTMDTVMTLTVYGTDKSACQAVLQQSQDRLYDLDRRLSATAQEGSDVYALNHAGGRPVALTGDTAQLLGKALDLCAMTDGALDLTAYSAVEAWGHRRRLPGARSVRIGRPGG